MNDRSEMISWIRSELVGPSRPLSAPQEIQFQDRVFSDPIPRRRGPLAWRPPNEKALEEVLYFARESPHRKYGAGLLHPGAASQLGPRPDEAALVAADTIGAELDDAPVDGDNEPLDVEDGELDDAAGVTDQGASDDFEVTSPDVRHPSTLGISFCASLSSQGRLVIRLPQASRLSWQPEGAAPVLLNGRYELCRRRWEEGGSVREAPVWRRIAAVAPSCEVRISCEELIAGRVVSRPVAVAIGCPLSLEIEVFPRKLRPAEGAWLVTAVLRNSTPPGRTGDLRESILYQTYFEVAVEDGRFERYPESQRAFQQLDADEQSLALLYRQAATWAIGHGCSAGWDVESGHVPDTLYADVMPAVQLPSMTPDIDVAGNAVRLSMRELSELSSDGSGPGWRSLEDLESGYADWIHARRDDATRLPHNLRDVAIRHLDACDSSLERIRSGMARLRSDDLTRRAFRLANLAMLLQQIATKQLSRRPLGWNPVLRLVAPKGTRLSPSEVFQQGLEDRERVGNWRAFQVAFLVMAIEGLRDGSSPDREVVDLIWFPTGGGKTEAYLAVAAFHLFHERLLMAVPDGKPPRDGTTVLMRYTLRMLTTQQFQRAASLICAMEEIRKNPNRYGAGTIGGERFSLGLWIGSAGSPNTTKRARSELNEFRRGVTEGNPLVLTECPWCRAEIGRCGGAKPKVTPRLTDHEWNAIRVRGISDDPVEGPRLRCPDDCEFGGEFRYLPVEVIDERLFAQPPSLVIATADKLAIAAYRPESGALFGRRFMKGQPRQIFMPPSLIIQDELHLISGPLGTMYALYEGIVERLCTFVDGEASVKPKMIASTATIRGAADQVLALYSRRQTQLFPSPGLDMGDSFFGRYARDESGDLLEGQLYLGIHAVDYGSVLTTQVRTFSSALFRPWFLAPERRDPWWTVLAFYNSLRELGGAKTLFDSDIRSRLKFLFNREDLGSGDRRNLRIVEELTSRLSQSEIIRMMDRLAIPYSEKANSETIDACLASSIIEVGVDIDRLSLMGVVGQPKATASYIQVTGRVGRRWWERPGLVLTVYNPSKSRDRSHFEQFHSYHRRLYEQVEPTTATPFAVSAIERALPGALITWARQQCDAPVQNAAAYSKALEEAYDVLRLRCEAIQAPHDRGRSAAALERVYAELKRKWRENPQEWEEFPPKIQGEYLMLWPGQFATELQKQRGVVVPSSMRQVDRSAELSISHGYASGSAAPADASGEAGAGGAEPAPTAGS